GQQTPRADSLRWYYQIVGLDFVIVVFQDDDYKGWQGREGIALFNFDTTSGTKICELFTKAPGSWAGETITQVTIKPARRMPTSRRVLLSQAIYTQLGRPSRPEKGQ